MSEKEIPQIWVDADACPNVIKQILFKAADRAKVVITFVANQYIKTPPSLYLKSVVVEKGFDIADNEIVARCNSIDMVITADIPLASEIIDKGAVALNPRGELYTRSNVRSRLNMRDFMDTMRSSGIQTGGPPPISQAEKQGFANELDKWLAKNR